MYRSNDGFVRTMFLAPDGDPSGGGDGGAPPAPEMVTFQDGDKTYSVPKTALKGFVAEKDLAERYVPKPAHNDQMARMRKELDALKGRKAPDELLDDEEFRTTALSRWGLDPNKNRDEFKAQLEKSRRELEEREIKPRETALQNLLDYVDNMRSRDLASQILQAGAALKVDEMYLKPAVKGGKPLIVSMLEGAFGFDEDHDSWFAKGAGDQFAYSQSGDTPYQGVLEFMQSWVNSDGKQFIRGERQKGPGTNAQEGSEPVPGQVGRELRLTEEQIRDIPFFKRMQAKAEKEGLTIVKV